jgi:hypothetical protein
VNVDKAMNIRGHVELPAMEDVAQQLRVHNPIPGGGSGILVETALAQSIGGFDESMSILADWDFYLRLIQTSSVALVRKPLVAYYLHLDSMFHDPLGLARELRYMTSKHSRSPHPSIHIDPTWWTINICTIACRLHKWRLAVHVLVAGAKAVGTARLAREIGGRLWRRITTPAITTAEIGRTVPWLEQYPPV